MLDTSMSRRALIGAGGAVAGAVALPGSGAARSPLRAPAPADEPAGTPHQALARLAAGNRRFVTGHARHPRQTPADVRAVAGGQHPFVIVLGCADSRVAPEIAFDQGVGDVFDNRVAGNVVDDLLLGSIEFAVEEFAPPLIMVLGHERCGAVVATLDAIASGGTAPGHIGAIVEALRPVVGPFVGQPDAVERGVRANVRAQARALVARSGIVREHVEAGTLAVVGARYDLDTGTVTLVP